MDMWLQPAVTQAGTSVLAEFDRRGSRIIAVPGGHERDPLGDRAVAAWALEHDAPLLTLGPPDETCAGALSVDVCAVGEVLHREGRVTLEVRSRLQAPGYRWLDGAARESAVLRLRGCTQLACEVGALSGVAQAGALDALLQRVDEVVVSERGMEWLRAENAAGHFHQETRQEFVDFRSALLASEQAFAWRRPTVDHFDLGRRVDPMSPEVAPMDLILQPFTEALNLAVELDLPLWVDDRASRVVVAWAFGREPTTRFTTDSLIAAAAAWGELPPEEGFEFLRALRGFNHRCLLLRPEEVEFTLRRCDGDPGGAVLCEVLDYHRDCAVELGKARAEQSVASIPNAAQGFSSYWCRVARTLARLLAAGVPVDTTGEVFARLDITRIEPFTAKQGGYVAALVDHFVQAVTEEGPGWGPNARTYVTEVLAAGGRSLRKRSPRRDRLASDGAALVSRRQCASQRFDPGG
jgi:hypothetical protein